MNLQRREEIRVMMNRLESTEWVEAGEYKEAMGELLAHIDALEQAAAERVIADGGRRPTAAPAALLPELTEEDLVRAGRPYCINDREPFERGARWAAAFIRERARAIPAGRVLGEGMVGVRWISVNDALPEDGQTVGFVTERANGEWYHRRALGGRYRAGEFGGFSVPGLMVQASYWFAFPPLPEALRANQGGAEHG